MQRVNCPGCGRKFPIYIQPKQRKAIRKFKKAYPWVSNDALAALFLVSTTRMSEIVRGDTTKRGL